MERDAHARYLEYRERHGYFGAKSKLLTAAEFTELDREQRELDAKDESRDDEEEARFAELNLLLLRD